MHSILTTQKVHEFQVELWIPLSVEHFESTFLAYCARYFILETLNLRFDQGSLRLQWPGNTSQIHFVYRRSEKSIVMPQPDAIVVGVCDGSL